MNISFKNNHSKNAIFQTLSNNEYRLFYIENGKNIRLKNDEAKEKKSLLENSGYHIQEVDSNYLIIERGLDLQTHLRFPGQDHKETLEGGLSSAFHGGYDSLVAMPNTSPFLDNPTLLSSTVEKQASAGQNIIKVAQTAAATIDMKGEVVTDIALLKEAGAIAITDDGWGVARDDIQDEVFRRCAENNLLFMQHAEMPGHGGFATASDFQKKFEIPEYPNHVESDMVKRDVELLRKHPKARYHVLHVTTKKSVEVIREAKKEGLNITAEVSPHHLMFCNEDIPDYNGNNKDIVNNFKMNPPLYGPEDRQALREALKDGTLDCLSTDHAPHDFDSKDKFWSEAAFGTRGLCTALGALTTLCADGILDYDMIEYYFSKRPREILRADGFKESKGFVILNKSTKWTVQKDDLPGKSKNSIFLGTELKGRIEGILTTDGYWQDSL